MVDISDDSSNTTATVETIKLHDLGQKTAILFSPVHGELDPALLASWILRDHLPVRLQIQMHKLLWGDGPGR